MPDGRSRCVDRSWQFVPIGTRQLRARQYIYTGMDSVVFVDALVYFLLLEIDACHGYGELACFDSRSLTTGRRSASLISVRVRSVLRLYFC